MKVMGYLFVLPFAAVTLYCTQGRDGEFVLLLVGLVLVGIFYVLTLLRTIKDRFSWHSVGHLVLFESVAVVSSGKELDGMAGMLYIITPIVIAMVVVSGALALLLRNPKKESDSK
jgi:hypothetical protein